ncbi:murein hydrolase activator EnvC family protein [Shumkonia mesophila]|uniref:murein hydrolase activator EnvC family protein n=1 Tax=Shumkonia mesophila TaxID=2838854 RepID=UPI0029346937|nr:peptidoglycan DD-metalloendopeptidase family protein [Shumkonia mesophila]
MSSPPPRWRLHCGLSATALISVLLLASAAAPVAAQGLGDPGTRLKEIDRAIEEKRRESEASQRKAEALDHEVQTLRREMIAAAAATQSHEAEVTRLEARLAELSRAETAKTAGLATGRTQFDRALMALQRIARHPPEALIVQPMAASDVVRSAILLRAAVPEIERRTEALRAELAEIGTIRQAASQRRVELAAATEGLKAERRRLDGLVGRKSALKRQADAESRAAAVRVDALAGEARDLRDLLAKIEEEGRRRDAERQARAAEEKARREREREKAKVAALTPATPVAPPPAAERAPAESGDLIPISKARGKLPFPVVGHLVGRYGQTTDAGLTRKGISIETRIGAQVVTPYDGLVVYAGQFRGYGQILILEHGEGYHTLLAGLTRIDTVPGQWLAAGEPVGVMESADRGIPVLYMELRRNGQPINPLPWLASQKDKVSG